MNKISAYSILTNSSENVSAQSITVVAQSHLKDISSVTSFGFALLAGYFHAVV